MSHTIRLSALKMPLVAGILSVAICVAAQASAPVIYEGLPHTALGNAVLQLDTNRNTLEVRTADPKARDGVAVRLGGTTTSWAAHLGPMVDPAMPLVMTWHALADGRRISTAVLRQVRDGVRLSARFTGATKSTYSVQVYDNGRLVGSVGGLPPTAQTHIPHWVPCEFLESGCSFVREFRNNVNHACEWGIRLAAAQRVVLPNGVAVVGDEVRLIEEVRPGGHYPYLSFDGITMQTNAPVLTLFSETAR